MFLKGLVSIHIRRRFMSDILEPKSIVNKANENIELVEFDEFINNIKTIFDYLFRFFIFRN